MKRLWIAVVILCGVVALCGGSSRYRHRSVAKMLDTLDQLEQAVATGNAADAEQLAEELTRYYEQCSRMLLCYTTHSDMTESQETVALLPTLLRQGNEDELQMEIARLRAELDYLRQIDDPLLQNIL